MYRMRLCIEADEIISACYFIKLPKVMFEKMNPGEKTLFKKLLKKRGLLWEKFNGFVKQNIRLDRLKPEILSTDRL